jgi:hypothetical protein
MPRQRTVDGTVYTINELVYDPPGWLVAAQDGATSFVQCVDGRCVGNWSDSRPFDPQLVWRIIFGVG